MTHTPARTDPAQAREPAPPGGSLRCAPWLLAITGAALALRLAVVALVPTAPVSDYWAYHQKALLMLHEGRYGGSPGRPDATFTPGYPLWLAGLFAVAPNLPTVTVAKVANAALGAVTVCLAGLLAASAAGRRAGMAAAAAAAFYPPLVLLPVLLASENLFLPLLLVFLLLGTRLAGRTRPLALAATAGAIVGLAALVRPVGYLLGLTWVATAPGGCRRWSRLAAELLLLLAVQHLVMAPWAVRNWIAFGKPAWLSSAGGVLMFMGNNPVATGRFIPWQEELQRLNPGVDLAALNQLELDAIAAATARRWMLDHPLGTARLALAKLRILAEGYGDLVATAITVKNATPPPEGRDALPQDHPLRRHAAAFSSVLAIASAVLLGLGGLAAAALLLARPRRNSQPRLCLLTFAAAAYFPLVTAPFVAYSRLRLPLDVVLLVLIGCGVALLERHHRASPASSEPATAARGK